MSTDLNAEPTQALASAPASAVGDSELEPLLSIAELSAYLDVPVATIYDWRVDGKGPRATRVGRHLRFAVGDVRTWLATLRETKPGGPTAAGG